MLEIRINGEDHMDNLIHLFYMGFCVVLFCLGLTILMISNKEISKMQTALFDIVTENVMVGEK